MPAPANNRCETATADGTLVAILRRAGTPVFLGRAWRGGPGMSFDWNDIPLLLKLADTGSMSQTGRLLGAWSRSQAWICSGVEGIHNCGLSRIRSWTSAPLPRADGAVHHPVPRHDHKMTRRVT